jgi:hypothetical protein
MLLSDAVVRGNGRERGKKGNGGNMKERPSSFPYLTQKNTRKTAVCPYCKLPIFFLCKCNEIKRFGLVLHLGTRTYSHNTTTCI